MTRRRFLAYANAIPVVAAMGLFLLLPMVSVGRLSFFQSDYLREKFVGFGNYIALFTDPNFWMATSNSAIYGLAFITGEVGIGLPIALMTFDLSKRWRNSVRILTLIPTTAAGIIICQVWLWIFHPAMGLANWLVSLVGIGPVAWFSSRFSATLVLFVVIALTLPGGGVVLLMAALAGVPKEILEAAKVDGASPWQTRLLVALPYVRTTVVLTVLIAFIGGAQVWEFVYAMTSGGPSGSTQSIMYYVYETGLLRSKYGLGAAASVALVLIVSLWSAGINRLQKVWK
jgi:ABC-type sugar transport system permease subunit